MSLYLLKTVATRQFLSKSLPICAKCYINTNPEPFNNTGCRLLLNQKDTNKLQPARLWFQQVRHKYDKKGKRGREEDEESSDEDLDDFHEVGDGKETKVLKTSVNSLRADLLIKAGLGIARNKVEVLFYESRVRVNGRKLPKKSAHINIRDEIDVIKGFSPENPNHLIVGRIEILSANPKGESITVVLRRCKSLAIENYESSNAWKSSSNELS